MRRRQADLRRHDVVRRPVRPLRAVGIDREQSFRHRRGRNRGYRIAVRGHRRGQHIGAVCIDQDHGGLGIDQHVAQAVAGITGIHRHIGAAGLQHREHRGDPRDRTLHADTDQHAGPDAAFPQGMREAVGAGVERAVVDGVAFAARGQRMRRARGVGFEPRVRRPVEVVIGRDQVAAQRSLALLVRQQVERAQPPVRRRDALLQQAQIGVAQPFDGLGAIQIQRIGPQHRDPVGVVARARDHHHVEIEFRCAVAVDLVDVQREIGPRQARTVRIVRTEGDLEQRIPAGLTLGLEFAHHPLERRFLMIVGLGQIDHQPREEFAVGRIAGQVAAHRHHVDEHADHAFGLLRDPVGHRRANQEIIAAGVARHRHLEHRLHRSIEGHAFGAAERAQRIGQRGRHFHAQLPAAIGRHRRARMIRRHRQPQFGAR